jgi:hypothetical protein
MARGMLQSAAMNVSRARFATFLSCLVAVDMAAVGCGEKVCPIPACSNWPVIGTLNLPAGSPAAADVVACHNDACGTAPLPTNSDGLLFDRTDVTGNVVIGADGALLVRVGWFVGANGDRYSVVVRDAAGGQLASVEGTPTFPPATSDGCPNLCTSVEFGDPP